MLSMVLTRGKCREEPPLILPLALHGAFLITGLVAIAALAVIGVGADVKAGFPFLLG